MNTENTNSVISVKPLDDYRLEVCFDDGTSGVVSLEERLFGPVFEPLRDQHQFRRVAIDEFGVICWPCGADLAPDALYQRLQSDCSSSEGNSTVRRRA